MVQQTLVFLIIALSIGYIAYRINKTMREAKSGCYGCKGCALREQMIKNGKPNRHKGGVENKHNCRLLQEKRRLEQEKTKKNRETFGSYKKD